MAVNVTCVPLQTVLAIVLMLTEGAVVGLTVITNGSEVAVPGEAHPDDEVSTTRTVSLLFNEELLKVLLLPLWFTPFTFHW